MNTFTPRLEHAIRTAAHAHRKQTRKGSDMPYIIHPFSVMTLVSLATDDEDVLVAALFHDIFEDVPEEYSREQMTKEFGERVVYIVDYVTKDDSLKGWQERSDAYLKRLEEQGSDESVMVSCADKIHNLMSVLSDYEVMGDDIWKRFNAGIDRQVLWYHAVYDLVERRLSTFALLKQYRTLLKKLDGIA